MNNKSLKDGKVTATKKGYELLIYALEEASKISFSLVFFPIILLLIGVWIDKRAGTTPLFIIIGIIAGVFAATYQLLQVSKKKLFSPEDNEVNKNKEK